MTKEDINNLSIIRTILWFRKSVEMPSDKNIINCYKNAKERFENLLNEEKKENE